VSTTEELNIDMSRTLVGQRLPWKHDWPGGMSGTFVVDRFTLHQRRVWRSDEVTHDVLDVLASGFAVRKDGTLGTKRQEVAIELADVPEVDMQSLIERLEDQRRIDNERIDLKLAAIKAELHGPEAVQR
jgi:hypothetical protein